MGIPAVLGAVGLAGSAVSAFGAYEAGTAQSQAAAYQAQVAQNNAQIARQNANLEIASGEQQTTIAGLRTRAAVGQEKASQGAAGVDVNKGSAVDVRAGQEEMGML